MPYTRQLSKDTIWCFAPDGAVSKVTLNSLIKPGSYLYWIYFNEALEPTWFRLSPNAKSPDDRAINASFVLDLSTIPKEYYALSMLLTA